MIGKVYSMPVEVKAENGSRSISFVLAVDRPFRESDGTYGQDFVRVYPWKGIAEQMKELCTVGSIIAVKGRIRCSSVVDDVVIIAEHIQFISIKEE